MASLGHNELTHKLEIYGCVNSSVATDGLVGKHQFISSHSVDLVQTPHIVLGQSFA